MSINVVHLCVVFAIVLGKIHHVAKCKRARCATKIFNRILSILFNNAHNFYYIYKINAHKNVHYDHQTIQNRSGFQTWNQYYTFWKENWHLSSQQKLFIWLV